MVKTHKLTVIILLLSVGSDADGYSGDDRENHLEKVKFSYLLVIKKRISKCFIFLI